MSMAKVLASILFVAATARSATDDPFEVFGQVKIAEGEGGFAGPLGPVDAFGSALAVLGDLDGNGIADVAVGAPNSGTPPGGAVWILFMTGDDTVLSATRLDATTTGLALDLNDQFGSALAALGDLDGDGHPELAVGAHNFGPGLFLGPGAVFVLSLDATGNVLASRVLEEGESGVPGVPSATGFGVSLAALGDLDGNGVTDLAVGDSVGTRNSETVWLFGLQSDGTALSNIQMQADLAVFGGLAMAGTGFGRSLGGLGDLDGNGVPDLALGESGAGVAQSGAAWVLLLGPGPEVASAVLITEGMNGFAEDVEDQAGFGGALVAGDIDDDGLTELVVGASQASSSAGCAWILGLDTDGLVTGAMQVADGLHGFSGPLEDFDQFASSVALLPDAGGAAQLVAGARGDMSTFLIGSGAAWILDLESADPWTDLGSALAGSDGEPELTGVGPLTEGSLGSLDLTHALALSTTHLILGFSAINFGFKGGLLVPAPDLLLLGLPTDGNGELTLGFEWPVGVPSGLNLYFQHWIADPAGPAGFAASNGLRAVTP